MHTTTPGVSRGTEIAHMILFNTRASNRSIYVINCLIAILVTYVKQQSNGHPVGFVTKHPCHKVAYIAIYWLVIARSLARLWGPQFFDSKTMETYSSHVFVIHGQVMTSEQLSDKLSDLTFTKIGVSLGIAAYRQAVRAIMKPRGWNSDSGAPITKPTDPTAVVATMMNHSVEVDKLYYGRAKDGFARILPGDSANSEAMCRNFHAFLGLDVDIGLPPGVGPFEFLNGEDQIKTSTAQWIVGVGSLFPVHSHI